MKRYLVDENANKYYICQRRSDTPVQFGMCQLTNRQWTLHSHSDTLEALTNRKMKYSLFIPPEIHEALRIENKVTSNSTFKVGKALVTMQIHRELSTLQFNVDKEGIKEDFTLKFTKEILNHQVEIRGNSSLIITLINKGEGDTCVARISTIDTETYRYEQLVQYEVNQQVKPRDILYFGATLYLLEDGVILYGDITSTLRPFTQRNKRGKTFKGNKETTKQIFQCGQNLGIVTSANFIQIVSGGRLLDQFRTGLKVQNIFYIRPSTFLIEVEGQFYIFEENSLLTKINVIGVQGVLWRRQYVFVYSHSRAWMFKWPSNNLHLWEVSNSFGMGLRNAFVEE